MISTADEARRICPIRPSFKRRVLTEDHRALGLALARASYTPPALLVPAGLPARGHRRCLLVKESILQPNNIHEARQHKSNRRQHRPIVDIAEQQVQSNGYLEVHLGAHLLGLRAEHTTIFFNSLLHLLNPVVIVGTSYRYVSQRG